MRQTRRQQQSQPPVKSEPAASKTRQALAPSGRRFVFRLLAALGIPLTLLLGTEGLLRLAGYGYSPRFFQHRQLGERNVWIDNQDFGRRFFPPGLVRRPHPFTLPAVKSPDTLRVFVLGESAAMGDPDFKFGLPRMLEALLRERFPNRRIEVVNAAMVAINSHVILPIARDCAGRSADLWIIYMGNNEIIGPFGSASVFGAQAPALPLVRAGLWAKTTRLAQLLDAGLYLVRQGSRPLPEWNGMEMMADQKVRYDAPPTERVYRHFKRNLADILAAGAHAGVPIVLCTVATNLKDCAPFASLHRPGLGEKELAEWQQAYDAGIKLQDQASLSEAQAAYERAARIDSEFAELAFRQGQCAQQLGQASEAAKFFRQARDEDALQFRADGRVNGMIRRAAAAFADQRVSLLDAEELFATNSPGGVPGGEYFYEHVHLTPEGNYLLARAVAEQAAKAIGISAAGSWISQAECLRSLGFTDFSRHHGLEVILDRIQGAPFTAQVDHARQVQQMKEQVAHYLPATKPAQVKREAQRVASLVAQRPEDPDLRWSLAALLEAAGEEAGAEEQWRALMGLQPQAALPAFNLARLLDGLGRQAEALPFYNQCLRVDPEYFPARYALGLACLQLDRLPEAIHHLKLAVRQKPGALETRLALGRALARARQPAEAEKQLREILRLDPNNAPAQAALREVVSSSGGQ